MTASAATSLQQSEKQPIQVLNLSFPRCGTMSVQAALNRLGYKCWHSTTCFGDVWQCRRWLDAQDAKFLSKGPSFTRSDWDTIFKGYSAISADPPAIAFAEELMATYPEAKVILVERDEDSWLASMDATVMDHLFRWDLNLVADLDPDLVGPVRDMQCHWARVWWGVRTKDEMRSKALEMYRQHNRAIRAACPPHRLLEFDLKDGWGPLCRFLEKEIPEEPFPVKNDRLQVKTRNRFIAMRGLTIVGRMMLKTVTALLACGLAWWLLSR